MTLLLDGCNKLARHEMSRVGALLKPADHSILSLLAPILQHRGASVALVLPRACVPNGTAAHI